MVRMVSLAERELGYWTATQRAAPCVMTIHAIDRLLKNAQRRSSGSMSHPQSSLSQHAGVAALLRWAPHPALQARVFSMS